MSAAPPGQRNQAEQANDQRQPLVDWIDDRETGFAHAVKLDSK